MRVLVTGGNGRIGRYLLQELASHGHEVTSLDLNPPPEPVAGVGTMLGNVARAEDIFGAIAYAKAEAVIHMAAWSDPGIVADTRTYCDNVSANFNVLDACFNLSVRRVLVASSAQVYGFAGHAPDYAPVDEGHPLRPLNSYALSKIACEEAASYFAKKGLSVLALRIMGARIPDALPAEIERVRANPASDRFLLWTRTDARDIATGCRQAIEVERVESGIYNLTGGCNVVGCPTADLFWEYSPTTSIRPKLRGMESGLSITKAQRAFGYSPRVTF
ncbi:NAD(P)-dependent oxidoreductase [Chelativorans sp. AA-79]|uniref:NAD-dependent epimerase/dehydratase family protein n=1 Tax=Chelativorans sp. AA-79 TaxID=3028735 RepID=UPI0023F68917|nr:NAD(P)-dependent oxidoreductase [Chelativorans sp. AA-79]WEX11103.1 NAD(P)-dependent oxidoreductase [Chelativorans sp. AA-79]